MGYSPGEPGGGGRGSLAVLLVRLVLYKATANTATVNPSTHTRKDSIAIVVKKVASPFSSGSEDSVTL